MSDSTHPTTVLASQLYALERRVRRLQVALLGAALAVGAAGATAFIRPNASSPRDVVTAKRLVLVDSEGNPGATIELASLAVPADANTPGGTDRSLRIMVSDSREQGTDDGSDSAHTGRGLRRAEFNLNPDRLSIALDAPDRLHKSHRSGVNVHAGPTLTLTRDGQAVYQIDPVTGGARPVLATGR